jgi:hypothetical protein
MMSGNNIHGNNDIHTVHTSFLLCDDVTVLYEEGVEFRFTLLPDLEKDFEF